MARKTSRFGQSTKTGKFTIGAKASANISKVEGLTLSRDMQAMFSEFARKGVPHDVRRATLLKKHDGKSS